VSSETVGLSWPVRVPTFTVSRTFSVRLSIVRGLASLCSIVIVISFVRQPWGSSHSVELQVVYLRYNRYK